MLLNSSGVDEDANFDAQLSELAALQSIHPDVLQPYALTGTRVTEDTCAAFCESSTELTSLALEAAGSKAGEGSSISSPFVFEYRLVIRPQPSEGITVLLDTSPLDDQPDCQCASSKVVLGRVTYVPAVLLTVVADSVYPSLAPPSFAIEAEWLKPDQLRLLALALSETALEFGPDSLVLAHWLDLLQFSLPELLRGLPEIVLSPRTGVARVQADVQLDGPDPRYDVAVIEHAASPIAPEQIWLHMLRSDQAARAREFAATPHDCPVCFDSPLGSQGCTLECGHWACKPCLSTIACLGVADSKPDTMRCPVPDCKAPFSPATVAALLPPAIFEKWDQLVLARTLSAMSDLVYCPRCAAATLEQDDLAQCGTCMFAFCSLCLEAWHPGTKCVNAAQKLAVLNQRVASSQIRDAEQQRRDMLERQRLEDEAYVSDRTKACPSCGAAISKAGGCNKVVCGFCSCFMCWKCSSVISGYEHFKEIGCTLFEESELRRWEVEWQAMQQAQGAPADDLERVAETGQRITGRQRFLRTFGDLAAPCPQCGQRNEKFAKNNHIKCWSCLADSCFICKSVLRGRGAIRSHFGRQKCPQHS